MAYNSLSFKIYYFFSIYLFFPLDYICTLVPCSSVIPHSGCQEQQDIKAALMSQIFSLQTEENGQLIIKSLFSRYIFFSAACLMTVQRQGELKADGSGWVPAIWESFTSTWNRNKAGHIEVSSFQILPESSIGGLRPLESNPKQAPGSGLDACQFHSRFYPWIMVSGLISWLIVVRLLKLIPHWKMFEIQSFLQFPTLFWSCRHLPYWVQDKPALRIP